MEQIGGQQEAFGASAVVELADRLYWDTQSDRLKRGAQGKSAGSPRRLVRFLRQFRRTFDPPSMNVEQLLEMLPGEFRRWRKPAQSAAPFEQASALTAGELGR